MDAAKVIILVCGGREYSDLDRVFSALDKAHDKTPITLLIQGGADGADRLAKHWAARHRIHSAQVDALWNQLGKGAGMARNRAMLLLRPQAVIAFPGGTGTAGMIDMARKAGIPVWEPYK